MKCNVCSHSCNLSEGKVGLCRVRTVNDDGTFPSNYGRVTSMALDPIEKKPIYMYKPGSMILSIGSYGCNMSCPFCQNNSISQVGEECGYRIMTPEMIASYAKELSIEDGNIGVAFTYNEPLIGYEFVRDTAMLICEMGLSNVLVSNGQASLDVLEEIIPYIHAMNIDLKAFSEDAYKRMGGDLTLTKDWIRSAASRTHLELTTLIVPGFNDDYDMMREEINWIASIDRSIPLHITRFFPTYRYTDVSPTSISLMHEFEQMAREHLDNVFLGNV